METVFLYALNDPVGGRSRYVGKASDPYARYEGHLRNAHREQTHKSHWICSLLDAGQLPVLEVLDAVPESEWQFWEKEWIRLYHALGFDLTNGTDGGDGGVPTAEIRAKIGVANTGKKRSTAQNAAQRIRMTGKPLPPTFRTARLLTLLGNVPTPETCAKLSLSKLGVCNPNFGKKLLPESIAKRTETRRQNRQRKK